MASDSPSFEELEIKIEDLKKQNELLRQNQGLSQQIIYDAGHMLFENSYSGNLLLDINGIYLGSNRRAAEAFGSTPDQIIGKSIFDFLPYETASAYIQKNKELIESGKSAEYEDTFQLETGEKTFLISDQVIKNEYGQGYALLSSSIDITERKQAEEALRESKKMYRLLARNLPGTSVFLFDHNFKFILAEGYLHPEFGFTTRNMEGKTLWEVLPEESAARLAPIYSDALQGIPTENLISEFDGHSYSVNVLPVKNRKGKIIAGMVVSQDITDRKLTEEALRNSEEKWKKLVHTLPDYVALYDRDGKYLFLNHFAEGFSIKDIESKSYTDLLADDSKVCYQQAFEAAKRTGNTQYVEHNALGDNWTIKHYESYFVPIFENNQFENMMVIARDITERKRAEAALYKSEEIFNKFLENSPIYIFFKDENIRSLHLSRNFEKMLGKPIEEMLGKSMDELFPSDFAKSMVETDLQILRNGEETNYEEEFNGRFYSTTKFPIHIDGKSTFLAGFTIDITEQKLAEKALQEREASLRELNATKDKFFSIIAHDLKSPFNSIIGFSSLLARQIQEKDFAAIEKYAGIIQNSSQQAMDLLMNLLEWSRSQTGRIVFSPEKIDILDLINQSTELLNASAQQKSIAVLTEIPVNLHVFADKAMIHTILRNLISNAIKFTKAGGEITVSAEQMSNEVVVSVLDNGVGIDKESISKLFRIDQNYTTLGTEKEKGTGLGLLLCKEFIEKHGGKIWVESTPGKGSKFCFTIPTKIPNTSA